MRTRLLNFALCAGFLATPGCTKQESPAPQEAPSSTERPAPQARAPKDSPQDTAPSASPARDADLAADPQKAALAMQEAMKNLGEGKVGPTVDFRELKALLPESLAGFKRTSARGEKNAAFGFNMSHAEAEYEGEADKDGNSKRIGINITDMSGSAAMVGLAAWAVVDIDTESDTGYEKTTTYSGFKGHEKYDTENKSGEINVLVGNRFLVALTGSPVKIEELKAAVAKIDLAKLAKLAPAQPAK